MRRFAAEKLSEEGRALIARLYLEDRTIHEIQAALKAGTGEQIARASLNRYCRNKLASSPEMRVLKRHRQALSVLLSNPSALSSVQVGLVASFAAILDLQYTELSDKLDELLKAVKEIAGRGVNPQRTRQTERSRPL